MFALSVSVVGVLLLRDVWHGEPVAAAFTRVGGATRVETALDASRFWLTPPQQVVIARAHASQAIMLMAAQCAMVHDAPLLFSSRDPNRQRRVNATIASWRKIAAARGSAGPDVVSVRNQRDVTSCRESGNPADIKGLSTLNASGRPLQLPQVAAGGTLAPVVVFAAARAPGDPPDVAVGLALAAHMATPDRKVSLVVVPRYLEADPNLEDQLRRQRELVEGGIVLGHPNVLPEDTRALLRQLLTSTNRQSILNQLQALLGSAGPVIAALLTLLGLGTATAVGRRIKRHVAELRSIGERTPWEEERENGMSKSRNGRQPDSETSSAGADLLATLGDDQKPEEVTVWLRSGLRITGTRSGQRSDERQSKDHAGARAETVLRLTNAELAREGSESKHALKFILIPVKSVELIGIKAEDDKASPSGTATDSAAFQ